MSLTELFRVWIYINIFRGKEDRCFRYLLLIFDVGFRREDLINLNVRTLSYISIVRIWKILCVIIVCYCIYFFFGIL